MASSCRLRSGACTRRFDQEAGRLLQKWRIIGSLLVDDGSRYLGIITDTDLSRKAVAKGVGSEQHPVMPILHEQGW